MLNYLYVKWVLNSKNIVVLALLVFIKKIIIDKLTEVYTSTNQPFCVFESGIMVSNSGLIVLLLSIFFVVIMSGYPSSDSNLYYQMIRCGRKRWFLAQMEFAVLAIFSYVILIFGFTFLMTQNISYLANGWSLNISDYAEQMGLIGYIPIQLFNQMPPVKAFVWSILLLVIYFYFLLGFQMAGFVAGKRKIVGIIQIIILFVGMWLIFLRNKMMWFFPQSHSILWIHFDKYFKQTNFSPLFSFMILFVGGTIFYIFSYIRIKREDIDIMREY